jgi:hypothetical protein
MKTCLHNADIKWIHVELSSKCNAWCPACPRNNNGFGLRDNLVEEDLPTARLEQVLKDLPELDTVMLCGNYGDPIIAKNILEAVAVAKQYAKKIQIHTNGSLRTPEWWANLATELNTIEHDVWFGIDGLAGVHEIYRQGTDFDKIIANAAAFIAAGGTASWQFIPYAHNEHQTRDCIKLSQKMGFKKFRLAKLFRGSMTARHYRTGEEFTLSAPRQEIQNVIRMPNAYTQVKDSDCMHLSQPSVYLAANGQLSTCCYFNNKTFDSVDELLYNALDLTHPTCLASCGSK